MIYSFKMSDTELESPKPQELIEVHKDLQRQCDTFFKELSQLQASLKEALRLLKSPSQQILQTYATSLPQFDFDFFMKVRKNLTEILEKTANGTLDVSLAIMLIEKFLENWEDKSEDSSF